MVDYSAKVKAKAFPKQEIYTLISKVKGEDIRVYLAMSFAMANRSGELLPYQHYLTTYKKNDEDKFVIDTRVPNRISSGIDVSKIRYKYDSEGLPELIIVDEVPVFKTKKVTFEKGYIYREGNPFFNELIDFVNKRKALISPSNKEVFLFELPEGVSAERFFWRFKKRVQLEVKKHLSGDLVDFKIHSLRSSRATDAAEASGGDIFYVQAITRHRELKNLQQYVQPVQMEQKIRKYEGKKV